MEQIIIKILGWFIGAKVDVIEEEVVNVDFEEECVTHDTVSLSQILEKRGYTLANTIEEVKIDMCVHTITRAIDVCESSGLGLSILDEDEREVYIDSDEVSLIEMSSPDVTNLTYALTACISDLETMICIIGHNPEDCRKAYYATDNKEDFKLKLNE